MKDSEFSLTVSRILNHIADTIEIHDQECKFDIDLSDAILTVSGEEGTYIINKQDSAKEIWLSSPKSGPYHFKCNNGRWTSKSNMDLFEVLSDELKIRITCEIKK